MVLRNTDCIFTSQMKDMAERNSHSYKCTDKQYAAATKRAKKLKFPLSNLIESVVVAFGAGHDVNFQANEEPSVTVYLKPAAITK